MNILNSTIANNTAQNGGGGLSYGGSGCTTTVSLTNSPVSGNVANSGGGIAHSASGGATLTMTNSTITNNRVPGNFGGGIGIFGGSVFFRNNIIAGNFGSQPDIYRDGNSTVTSLGNNLIGSTATSGAIAWQASDILNQSPRFVPLGNYGGATMTHPLLSGSLAINAGQDCVTNQSCASNNPFVALPNDQRGAARVGAVDIGSFEVQIATAYAAVLPNGRVGTPYNYVVSQYNNSAGSYTFTATGLPAGLSLTTQTSPFAPEAIVTVVITGTPTVAGGFTPEISITDSGGNSTTINYSLRVLVPTAATVSIGGRVALGKDGLARARVTLTDMNGETRSALTNPFGYYRFDDVAAGETYIISVSHKRYFFATQAVSPMEDLTELNFMAEQ